MRTPRIPLLIATASSVLLAGFFFLTSMAGAMPAAHVSGLNSLIGATNTDSAGSYSYEDDKKEGSKSKAAPPKGHGKVHGKKEGSGSKKYSASKHGYTHHKKEGSGGKKYSHGSPHKGKPGHGHKSSGHKGKHGKNPFKHILCFEKKLGLTAAQVEQIKSGEFEYKKFKVQSHASHAIAHMELDRLVHAETVDEAKIRSVGDRITEIKSATIHAMIEAKILILKILTPEQRSKVKQMHSKR
jgi:Spy/CpxP family protein refolding chaperone